MISGYAKAYQALGRESFLQSAVAAANFIRTSMYDSLRGTLKRAYRGTEAGAVDGFVEDYAFLIQGTTGAFETGPRVILEAQRLRFA